MPLRHHLPYHWSNIPVDNLRRTKGDGFLSISFYFDQGAGYQLVWLTQYAGSCRLAALVLSGQTLAFLVLGPLLAYRESPTRREILLMLELRGYITVCRRTICAGNTRMTDVLTLSVLQEKPID